MIKRFLLQFVKDKSYMDEIEYVNNVPKVCFVCWFNGYGNQPMYKMSNNRFSAFKSLTENIKVPVILITEDNMRSYEIMDHPIPDEFDYLSGVHKSDYMRVYLLHHYGGAYHDIKHHTLDNNWSECWTHDDWTYDDNIWMYGRREKNPDAIGYPPGGSEIKKHYKQLVTMGAIIIKSNTPFTTQLLLEQENVLKKKSTQLKKNPGSLASGYYSENPFQILDNIENKYPLRWLEILGEIFHPLMLEFSDHIKYGLPDFEKKRYK